MDPHELLYTRPSRREFVASMATFALSSAAGCSQRAASADFSSDPARLHARVTPPTRTIQPGSSYLGLAAAKDGLLYVPRSYRPSQAMPLVLLLHGAGGRATNWFGSYGERAESLGIIMLAPESRGQTWDAIEGTFGPDVTFLDSALRYTFEHCAIDPGRIALAGFSDGASYAISLGLPNGDLFSHVIAYSPGFTREQPANGRPRIFVSHGTNDGVLPIAATGRTIVPRLRARGYTVEYTEFKGGHEVPASITTQALDWFLRPLKGSTTPHRPTAPARAQRAQQEQQQDGADECHNNGAG